VRDTITIGAIGGSISSAIFLVADWFIATIFEIDFTSPNYYGLNVHRSRKNTWGTIPVLYVATQ